MAFLAGLFGFVHWSFLFFGLRLPLIILGFLAIPIAYPFRTDNHLPKWAWIWDNDQDGIYGPHWFHKGNENFRSCWLWSAVRNPVNNMRFAIGLNREDGFDDSYMFGDEGIPTPKKARIFKRATWHLTLIRVGWLWHMSFWYIKPLSNLKHFRIRIGWKCTPDWVHDINISKPETLKYSGITFQFMPNRDG